MPGTFLPERCKDNGFHEFPKASMKKYQRILFWRAPAHVITMLKNHVSIKLVQTHREKSVKTTIVRQLLLFLH